jgi:hypothetical protein
MVKFTFAVAALLVGSVAGTRVQAQSEQFASVDQTPIVQDVSAPATVDETPIVQDVSAPATVDETPLVQDASAPAAVDQTPLVQDVSAPATVDQTPIVQDVSAPATADISAPSGPSMEASTLSPRFSRAASVTANTMRRPTHSAGVGLMIFGGAALITGLVIGGGAGTVIAVGGALVGLYGLYVYLGRPTGMEQGSRIGLGYKLNTN